MDYTEIFAKQLSKHLVNYLTLEQVENLIEKPKFQHQGDLAFPCLSLAK